MQASQTTSGQDSRPSRHAGLPRIQTETPTASNRFSFSTTPKPEQQAVFESIHSRRYTIIDDSPMATQPPYTLGEPLSTIPGSAIEASSSPGSPYPEDKKVPLSAARSPHNAQQPQEVHPAFFAPYAQQQLPEQDTQYLQNNKQDPQHQQRHQSSLMNVLAAPTFADPRTPPQAHPSTDHKQPSGPQHPHFQQYSRHNPTASELHPPLHHHADAPAYTPTSPFGPNASVFAPHLNHQPGQISHPLSRPTNKPIWTAQSSLLAPSASCLGATLCPCVAYGRTQYRLNQLSRKASPMDLLGYKRLNSDCGIMGVLGLCGLGGVLAAVQRTRVRRAYRIEGGFGGDCLRGCCCCCCVLGASEREMLEREGNRERLAGPDSGASGGRTPGYVNTVRMEYAQIQR